MFWPQQMGHAEGTGWARVLGVRRRGWGPEGGPGCLGRGPALLSVGASSRKRPGGKRQGQLHRVMGGQGAAGSLGEEKTEPPERALCRAGGWGSGSRQDAPGPAGGRGVWPRGSVPRVGGRRADKRRPREDTAGGLGSKRWLFIGFTTHHDCFRCRVGDPDEDRGDGGPGPVKDKVGEPNEDLRTRMRGTGGQRGPPWPGGGLPFFGGPREGSGKEEAQGALSPRGEQSAGSPRSARQRYRATRSGLGTADRACQPGTLSPTRVGPQSRARTPGRLCGRALRAELGCGCRPRAPPSCWAVSGAGRESGGGG